LTHRLSTPPATFLGVDGTPPKAVGFVFSKKMFRYVWLRSYQKSSLALGSFFQFMTRRMLCSKWLRFFNCRSIDYQAIRYPAEGVLSVG
jgi:hypothetical protein